MYPAHSRVGRGNIVIRYSVPHFPPNFRGIACWMAEFNAGLLLWCQSEEMKILRNNNLFPRVEIEPTTVALQTPCAPAPRRPRTVYLLYLMVIYICLFMSLLTDTNIFGTWLTMLILMKYYFVWKVWKLLFSTTFCTILILLTASMFF